MSCGLDRSTHCHLLSLSPFSKCTLQSTACLDIPLLWNRMEWKGHIFILRACGVHHCDHFSVFRLMNMPITLSILALVHHTTSLPVPLLDVCDDCVTPCRRCVSRLLYKVSITTSGQCVSLLATLSNIC